VHSQAMEALEVPQIEYDMSDQRVIAPAHVEELPVMMAEGWAPVTLRGVKNKKGTVVWMYRVKDTRH